MQRFLVVSFMLTLVAPVGQALAGSDNPPRSSGAAQENPGQENGPNKTNKGRAKAARSGVVSGLEVGGSAKSASSVSISPGTGVSSDGRSLSRGRQDLPDPRSE